MLSFIGCFYSLFTFIESSFDRMLSSSKFSKCKHYSSNQLQAFICSVSFLKPIYKPKTSLKLSHYYINNCSYALYYSKTTEQVTAAVTLNQFLRTEKLLQPNSIVPAESHVIKHTATICRKDPYKKHLLYWLKVMACWNGIIKNRTMWSSQWSKNNHVVKFSWSVQHKTLGYRTQCNTLK